MAARQHYVEYGGEVSEVGMEGVIENYVPSGWINRTNSSVRDWARSVFNFHNQLFGEEPQPSREFVKAEMVLVAKTKWYKVFSRFVVVVVWWW